MKHFAFILMLGVGVATGFSPVSAQPAPTPQGTTTASQQDPLPELLQALYDINDAKAFETRYQAFRQAVLNHDREAVADMLTFPAQFNINRGQSSCASRAEFLARYDELIDGAVVNGFTSTPTLKETIMRYEGIGVGNGVFWFTPSGNGFALVAVNNGVWPFK